MAAVSNDPLEAKKCEITKATKLLTYVYNFVHMYLNNRD